MSVHAKRGEDSARVSPLYDPKIRGLVFQITLLAAVLFFGWELVQNARENLANQRIATGFGFLDRTSGFDVSQALVPYDRSHTYGRAFTVGLLNTLLVASIGIVFATVFGFLIGIARLSKNFVVSRLAMAYVEVTRNLPLLFQILFWYLAVLGALPGPRQSVSIGDAVFLNNRGIIVPEPIFGGGWSFIGAVFVVGVLATILLARWARLRQAETGQTFPVFWSGVGLILGAPFLVFLALGMPLSFGYAQLRGFNFVGGVRVIPEFVALLVALSIYTAGFIAEIVRAGIQAVSHGQTEASYSLGMKPGPTLRLVVIPQAMRVIIPPLTSQYLNLTKNSSLAVAIGYPDLVAVFAGTTLNQTGQAIEIIAVTMAVYLVISLMTSAFMNYYNQRMALVER